MNIAVLNLDILFIEDNIDDVDLALLSMKQDGIGVNWKLSENETGLRLLLTRWQPDIILSDYTMPEFRGDDALRICKELAPDVPFIFVSGTIGEELAIKSIHDGATDYILKDNMRRLGMAVRRAVEDARNLRKAREIEKERSRLSAILEAASDVVGIAHPDESLLYLNQSGLKLLGLEHGIAGLMLEDIHSRQHWSLIREKFLTHNRGGDTWKNDSLLIARDGTEIPVSQVLTAHRGTGGNIEYYSFIARDLRDRMAYEQKIKFLANFDALTEMPNRNLLTERTLKAITHSRWTKRILAILVINIDRFKLVNAAYGHNFGDELLRAFSSRLRSLVGGNETVARLSTDNFAILATDLQAPEDAILLVNRLQDELSAPFEIQGHSVSLTTGIGVSVYPRDGTDVDALIGNAEAAMHRLKESGESGFQFYTNEMTESASLRMELEAELKNALVHEQFELHFQPQVNLDSGALIGFEALLRWQHPVRGMVPPDKFIPIAESSDLICYIGEWVLQSVCTLLKQWDDIAKPGLRMAVNVSPRQFRSKGFVEMIKDILHETGLEPECLELEITESILVQDQEAVAAILEKLNALGLRISLDDFGTGYSNLSYLSRMPIDALKIDKSFVMRSLQDNNDREIVRAIISLAESLELDVMAEGIETRKQLDLLREYRCTEGQGYYFSRPLSLDEARVLLETGDPLLNPGKSKVMDYEPKDHTAG